MAWSDLKSNWVTGDNFAASNENAVAAAINVLANGAVTALVATSENTTSTSYADLTTTTDTVTVTVGSSGKVMVLLSGSATNGSGNNSNSIGFALSGANTVAASDAFSVSTNHATNANGWYTSGMFLLTGLTAGSTVFKMKYKVTAGTGTFVNRRISVIPFP
jgi:hypothetical protein